MNCLLVSKSLLYIGVLRHCLCVNFWKAEIVTEMPHAVCLTNFCKNLSASCTSEEKDGKLWTHTSKTFGVFDVVEMAQDEESEHLDARSSCINLNGFITVSPSFPIHYSVTKITSLTSNPHHSETKNK